MPTCKHCGAEEAVKNGIVAGKQRYHCKQCGYNFREGDGRTGEKFDARKALCILLSAMAKGSSQMMQDIPNPKHDMVHNWMQAFGEKLPEPDLSGRIARMAFDEMWDFVGSHKASLASAEPLTVAHGTLWPGCSAILILLPSNDAPSR